MSKCGGQLTQMTDKKVREEESEISLNQCPSEDIKNWTVIWIGKEDIKEEGEEEEESAKTINEQNT